MTNAGSRCVLRCDGNCGSAVDVDVEVAQDRITNAEVDDALRPLVMRLAERIGWRDGHCPTCAVKRGTPGTGSAMHCDHANEVPTGLCLCSMDCYCKGRTCRSRL